MYQRHVEPNDFLSTLGDAVEGFLEEKMEEIVPGPLKAALLGPNRQDILGIMRMKNQPAEGKNKAALQIMAEVRSYYDCQ